jgi:hypothetical protein
MTNTHIKIQELKAGDVLISKLGVKYVVIHNDRSGLHYGWGQGYRDPRAKYSLYAAIEGWVSEVWPSRPATERALSLGVAEPKFKFGDIVHLRETAGINAGSDYNKGDKLLVTRVSASDGILYRLINESGKFTAWTHERNVYGSRQWERNMNGNSQ